MSRSPFPLQVLKALPAPQSEEDKETVIPCGVCFIKKKFGEWTRSLSIEAAGHGFHKKYEMPIIDSKRKGKKQEAKEQVSDDEDDSKWRSKHKKKESNEKKSKATGTLKLSPELEDADLYALLEVSEGATDDQIKKSYRQLALKYHPDKVKAEGKTDAKKNEKGLTEADLLFVRIQGAYEILSDTAKRRQYDSTLDFDDDFPEEVAESVGFYKTFAPVFNRNARFSLRRPVPDIGDDKTDLDKVHKFYDWWYGFESWRDFSQHAEFNLDDAEFREEKRWMERQNQKILKKYDQDERKRVLTMVETAERLDPRIKAEREEKERQKREEKEKRARMKQEEEDAKKRAEEEKQRKIEQEKAEKEEQERLEKEKRKEGKQVLKGLRQRLKKSLPKASAAEADEVQEWILSFEDPDPLEALCVRLEGLTGAAAIAAAVNMELSEWRKRCEAEKAKEEKHKEEARKLEEDKAKKAKEAAAAAATGKEWTLDEMGMLSKGLSKFPGGYGGRWAAIAGLLESAGFHRAESEITAKVKELSEGASLRSMGSTLDSTFKTPAGKAKAAPKAKAAEAEKPAEEASAEWTADQQKALEAALVKYPATMDKNERWRSIAEAVAGKTKTQCVERFKYLREQVKKKG